MGIKYDARLHGKGAKNGTNIFDTGNKSDPNAEESSATGGAVQSATGGGGTQQQAPQSNLATKKPSSGTSGMYTNLNKYVEKNKPAAQNMAKSIGDTVQRNDEIARKKIVNARTQFGTQMEQGSLKDRDNAVSDVAQYAKDASQMSAAQTPDTVIAQAGDTGVYDVTRDLQNPDRPLQTGGPVQRPEATPPAEKQPVVNNSAKIAELESQIIKLPFGGDTKSNIPIRSQIAALKLEDQKAAEERAKLQAAETAAETAAAEKQAELQKIADEKMAASAKVNSYGTVQGDGSEKDLRLKAILDAKYKGPNQLSDLANFGEVQRRAQEAGRLNKQLTGGVESRRELLNKAFQKTGSNYTQGAKKLDELLFGQGKPQEYLSERQKQIGNIGDHFTSERAKTRQEALDRVNLTSDIKSQARQALQDASQKRAGSIEEYLSQQKEVGGNLVDHYRDVLTQGTSFDPEGQLIDAEGNKLDKLGLNLGSAEAQALGVRSGAGIYNLLRDQGQREDLLKALDKRGNLSSDTMVTKDQQAQLAELQRMAQLSSDYGVKDSGLNYRSAYQDANKAGTQTALDALDTAGFRRNLTEAEERFRDDATNTITGKGRGKASYDKGLFRTGYKKATNYQTDTLKNALKDKYDFDSDPNKYTFDNESALSNLSNLAKNAKGEHLDDSTMNPEDYFTGTEAILDKIGLGDLALGNVTKTITNELGDAARYIGDDLIGGTAGDILSTYGGGAMREIGNFGSGLFGGGSSAARKKAKQQAKKNALNDLKRKMTGNLSKSGFADRVNVEDTIENQERSNALMNILSQADLTNR
jgi:hypothetical protein